MSHARTQALEAHIQAIVAFCERHKILHGEKALREAGFPYLWYKKAMVHAFKENISLAVRVGTPPKVDKGYRWVGKPIYIKTKMSILPFVNSTLPEDQETFGKLPPSPPIILDERIGYAQLPIQGREILEQADFLEKKGNYLEFSAKIIPGVLFRIDLRNNNPPLSSALTTQKVNPWSVRNTLDFQRIKNHEQLSDLIKEEMENDFFVFIGIQKGK